MWQLQAELLGLGLGTAKSALDTLLGGYYSVAYASIRNMIETFLQYLYVGIKPDAATRWSLRPGGPAAQPRSPGVASMVKVIKDHPDIAKVGLDGPVGTMYRAWDDMSKGSHPTGFGLQQTRDGEARSVFGATYDPELMLLGLEHGLAALKLLLRAVSLAGPQSEDWMRLRDAWEHDASAWEGAAFGEAPTDEAAEQ